MMMRKLKHLGLFISIITMSSCYKDLIIDTSSRGDFNVLFEYLENDYAYRENHSFTMQELKQKYLPQIEKLNTQKALANVFVEIENELKDPHFYFGSSVYELADIPVYARDSLETIKPIMNAINIVNDTRYYTYGTVSSDPKIGYLHIKAFNTDIGGTNSLEIETGVRDIDNIIQELISDGVASMIVDIRSTAGGSNYVPRYIAQRFIDKSATYMIEYFPHKKLFKKKGMERSAQRNWF